MRRLAVLLLGGCNVMFGIDDLRPNGSVRAEGGGGAGGESCAGCEDCPVGFERLDAQSECSDVDECSEGLDDCHPEAQCVNEPGSYVCRCDKPGFIGDGKRSCHAVGSCDELHTAEPTLSDGVYPLDPGGQGSFSAYCDMTTDGGGWTLVMKLTSTTTTFAFDSTYWNTATVLNESDLAPNITPMNADEAKFIAFNRVRGRTLRLAWLDPEGHDFVHAGLAARTALELFQGGEELIAGSEVSACHGPLLLEAAGYLASHMRHAEARQFFGINGTDIGNDSAAQMLRFGFGSNDEPLQPWEPKQAAGVEGASLIWYPAYDCSGCGCYGTPYMPAETSANLWVR